MDRSEILADMETAFQGNEHSAMACLRRHSWLLIPHVTPAAIRSRKMGCYAEAFLDDKYRVDFAVYYKESSELHWEFVEIQSPTARVLRADGGRYSTDFSEARRQIEEWEAWFAMNGARVNERFPDSLRKRAYRIVIGDSKILPTEDRNALYEIRSNNLRIRTFRWFFEKLDNYNDNDIEQLEELGTAKTQKSLTGDNDMLRELSWEFGRHIQSNNNI